MVQKTRMSEDLPFLNQFHFTNIKLYQKEENFKSAQTVHCQKRKRLHTREAL